MLKIKDNVDLKELQKYGLKKQPKPYSGYYLCVSRGVQILFVTGARIIMVEKWRDYDPRIHKRPNCKYRSNKTILDVLYILIKEGLVERVGECKDVY